MMKRVRYIVFAGTSEGRELAEYLDKMKIPACVCVATEYGEELMDQTPYIDVRSGRMDADGMEKLIRELSPQAVVDATHPYADVVTKNIRSACKTAQVEYLRLLRAPSDLEKLSGIMTFPDCLSAAKWLNGQSGNVFLTTGMKELPVFAGAVRDRERLYARVLLQENIFDEMERSGLSKKQMICMQGPFTRDLNAAMLKQVKASFLVTKESGTAGGFLEKVEAARDAGAVCVVIRRPEAEEGYSLEEVKRLLSERLAGKDMSFGERPENHKLLEIGKSCQGEKSVRTGENAESVSEKMRRVTLLGIGMGDPDNMTVEAVKACEQSECIIGAERMLKTLSHFGKPMVSMYRSEEIAAYVEEHPEYGNIVIGLSGDVGFYSGAKRLTEALRGVEVHLLCGISSVVYFASKLQTSWEDMVLVSSHGRDQNVIGAVLANPKVFTLASDAKSIRLLAEKMVYYGLSDVKMTIGADLSYPAELIQTGCAEDFLDFDGAGICVALLENERAGRHVVTHGISDEQFIRGKAPMTKEEVRSISISKLRLTKDAVVYDVGAGTGSVAVECARIAQWGNVYAIERKEDALALMEQNRQKFGVSNLHIVSGNAPEALGELPVPTHAFIGGSGGNLKEIVAFLLKRNPAVRIVINCITLETVSEAMELLKELNPDDLDICCINIAKSRTLAGYHMMTGQNPVYIVSLQFGAF